MSEQNNGNTPPAIEDAINEKLPGEAQKNALDFVSFMRENGFTFEGFDLGHAVGWNPAYNGKGIGCSLKQILVDST